MDEGTEVFLELLKIRGQGLKCSQWSMVKVALSAQLPIDLHPFNFTSITQILFLKYSDFYI